MEKNVEKKKEIKLSTDFKNKHTFRNNFKSQNFMPARPSQYILLNEFVFSFCIVTIDKQFNTLSVKIFAL